MDENDFRQCYGDFFRKYLITAFLKVLFQQLEGTLTTAFERHFTIENFIDMDHHKYQAFTKTYDLLYYMLLSLKQAYFSNLI